MEQIVFSNEKAASLLSVIMPMTFCFFLLPVIETLLKRRITDLFRNSPESILIRLTTRQREDIIEKWKGYEFNVHKKIGDDGFTSEEQRNQEEAFQG